MKKIFFLTFSLLVTAFAYQGCKPVDNSKAWAKADSIAGARLMMSRDSMKLACTNDVMNAAKMRADSMMAAMQNHGSSKGSKPKPPAPPAKQPGVSDRPGSQQAQPKSISDRKGTTDTTHGPKKISDRKGVNAPPK